MIRKNKTVKFNFIELLIIIVLAYIIAPVVSRFISTVLTTYFYMLIVVVLVFLVFFVKGNKSANDCFFLLLPFLCWKGFAFLLPKDNLIIWAYGALLDILPLLLGYFFVNHVGKSEKLEFFVRFLFAAFLITGITTILGCIQYPDAARYMATVENSSEARAVLYTWNNIGGYSFVYMLVLLHPVLILAYKKQRIKKVTAIFCSVAIVSVTIFSAYATALLLALLSCFFYFFKKNLSIQALWIWIIFGVVLVIFSDSLFSKALLWLADVVNNDIIAYRLEALAGGKVGIEGSEDNRIALYEASLNTFFKNPILGSCLSGGGGIGGHSFILDFMAQFGIIGAVVLFLMYRIIYIKFFLPYKNREGYGFILWMFIQAILLSLINTGMFLPVLAIFIPVFLKFVYKES